MQLTNYQNIQKVCDAKGATLIAVSKRQSDDRIEEALAHNLRIFGENQVQEAKARWSERRKKHPDLELHCLGPLQSNKVKDAVALFDVIHSVDRLRIAKKIVDEQQKQQRNIQCFIQVNTGQEDQKSGVMFDDLKDFYLQVTAIGLNVIGLMCIPPMHEEPAFHFVLLKKKADELGLKNLSMGMSNDYETALCIGATHVRLGTAIFGLREV